MKNFIFKITIFLCFGIAAKAQTAEDILRYSFTQPIGSARALGMGGAFGSAGADLSAASINPAGLGLYRRNEIMGSTAINAFNADATYNGYAANDGRTSFNLPNFGAVFNKIERHKGKDATQGLVSGSFAFGLNRTNSFQKNIIIEGNVNNSSRANAIAKSANGRDSSAFWDADYDNDLAAMAWRLRLIDNDGSSKNYASQYQLLNDTNYTNQQLINHKMRGASREYFVSGGLNISNFLYLGASIIVNEIDFSSDATYSENTLAKSSNNPINSFTISEYYRTSGSGLGGKFGLIIRPVDAFRFGVAYQTPIRHNLTDNYQNTISVNYNGVNYTEAINPREDFFEYQLLTPGKFTFSGSLILGKYFMLNADYEMVDYTAGRLAANGFVFNAENNKAKTNFNANGNNYRVGGEFNYEGIRFRAGYAYYDSPYNTTLYRSNKADRTIITGGIGTTINKDIFIDLAVVGQFNKTYLTPYDNAPSTAVINNNQYSFIIGGGFRF